MKEVFSSGVAVGSVFGAGVFFDFGGPPPNIFRRIYFTQPLLEFLKNIFISPHVNKGLGRQPLMMLYINGR